MEFVPCLLLYNNTFIGLELLLNVDQFESVPYVDSSSGVVICPLHDVGEYLDAHARVFVPTGFQANIAVLKVCLILFY